MIRYYDRKGKRISMERLAKLLRDADYKRVARTEIGKYEVSTVWLGLDHSFTPGVRHIFETMVFTKDDIARSREINPETGWIRGLPEAEDLPEGVGQERYGTMLEAIRGHDAMVKLLEAAVAVKEKP